MKQSATAIFLAFALCSAASIVVAEPYEDTPDAAARDPDYAAGKEAMAKKDWAEAVKRFHQAPLVFGCGQRPR